MASLLSHNRNRNYCCLVLVRITGQRGREWIRCAVDPTPFPRCAGHQFERNSAAFVLRQNESLRFSGLLDCLQYPAQFFSIHGENPFLTTTDWTFSARCSAPRDGYRHRLRSIPRPVCTI